MAELFKWDDSYSVGVEAIDNQHKTFIKMLNGLWQAMKDGKGADVLNKTLDEVVSYTSVHFKFEEMEMRRVAYPDYAAHKKIHDAFVAEAQALQSDIKSGTTAMSIPVMNKLKSWLIDHIVKTDGKYSPYLTKKAA